MPMTDHIITALKGLALALTLMLAIAGGTALGGQWDRSLDDALRPEYRRAAILDADAPRTITQGWGQGDCKEDEWFDGVNNCIHRDLLPADDARFHYIKGTFTY